MTIKQYYQNIKQQLEKDFEPDYSKKETKEAIIEQKKREFEKDFMTDKELEEVRLKELEDECTDSDDFLLRLFNGGTNDE